MGKFQKATKKQARARIALIGPSGSGKTYSALAIATSLGARVAVIDTERGSASKYADLFPFDVLELTSFSPDAYVDAIRAAESEAYDVVVVDSLSHAWMGKDGALEQVDAASARQKGNSYTAWRDVTPRHNRMIDAIVGSRCHVIATMRAKTEYVLEEDRNGKKVPKKVGMAAIQRDGMEYEFDVTGDLTLNNDLCISKTRCSALAGKVFHRPGEEFAAILREWLSDGAPAPEPPPLPTSGVRPLPATQGGEIPGYSAATPAAGMFDGMESPLVLTEADFVTLREWIDATGTEEKKILDRFHITRLEDISPADYGVCLRKLRATAAAGEPQAVAS